jgi:murein DD-endopeptidase MepM/ murein hydrolase activator NlpD
MSQVTYTVKPGDTLSKVCLEQLGDPYLYQEVADYNKLAQINVIEPGQVLEIPPWLPRRFRFPLEKTETPYYKFGSLYASGRWKGRPHPGVDFHEANGARVYAVGDGVIRVQRKDPHGYGFYTMIEHRTKARLVWSLYAHFAAPAMHGPGVWVQAGQHIGWEGDTGASGGLPHLHFEIKRTPSLGLYDTLTPQNLTSFYHDPYVFLSQAVFLPVSCWECPRCS